MDVIKNSCDCCGTCCLNGGPALHTEDLDLFTSNQFSAGNLVTIRKEEMVYLPLSKLPQQAESEFVKIQGHGGDWSCMFFNKLSSVCTIYEKRPVACRLLKCWDPEDILNITGKKLLNRFDMIKDNDPLLAIIHHHEKTCPVPLSSDLSVQLKSSDTRTSALEQLEILVNSDLRFRVLATREHNLTLPEELFYFGRPIFQLLVPFGITSKETPVGLSLYFDNFEFQKV